MGGPSWVVDGFSSKLKKAQCVSVRLGAVSTCDSHVHAAPAASSNFFQRATTLLQSAVYRQRRLLGYVVVVVVFHPQCWWSEITQWASFLHCCIFHCFLQCATDMPDQSRVSSVHLRAGRPPGRLPAIRPSRMCPKRFRARTTWPKYWSLRLRTVSSGRIGRWSSSSIEALVYDVQTSSPSTICNKLTFRNLESFSCPLPSESTTHSKYIQTRPRKLIIVSVSHLRTIPKRTEQNL